MGGCGWVWVGACERGHLLIYVCARVGTHCQTCAHVCTCVHSCVLLCISVHAHVCSRVHKCAHVRIHMCGCLCGWWLDLRPSLGLGADVGGLVSVGGCGSVRVGMGECW